jgi:hypothetical protein
VRDVLVQINRVDSIEEVIGPAKLLQDIDLVSLEEQVPTDQRKLCKGYTGGDVNFTNVGPVADVDEAPRRRLDWHGGSSPAHVFATRGTLGNSRA